MLKKIGDAQPITFINLDDVNDEQAKKVLEAAKETMKQSIVIDANTTQEDDKTKITNKLT